jgi:hypothetical protein
VGRGVGGGALHTGGFLAVPDQEQSDDQGSDGQEAKGERANDFLRERGRTASDDPPEEGHIPCRSRVPATPEFRGEAAVPATSAVTVLRHLPLPPPRHMFRAASTKGELMAENGWHVDRENGFQLRLPAGWVAEPDPEQGGLDLWHPDGAGELHLFAFPPAAGEQPDPGEELYAFLQENGIELEEDEIEDFDLAEGGLLAFCQYLSEDEEEEETAFWLVGVAALPTGTVFTHYTCAAEDAEQELDQVYAILRSLRSVPPG